MSKYHICQSIAGLEAIMKERRRTPWLTIDGRPATYAELRKAIAKARSKGYTVIPPCDNVDETGHCAGHDEIP